VVSDGGLVIVADTGNRRLQVFDLEGRFLTQVTETGDGGFQRPVGLAVSRDRLYVADADAHRIVRLKLSVVSSTRSGE
jgi:sugar lactone lactonase YvrE